MVNFLNVVTSFLRAWWRSVRTCCTVPMQNTNVFSRLLQSYKCIKLYHDTDFLIVYQLLTQNNCPARFSVFVQFNPYMLNKIIFDIQVLLTSPRSASVDKMGHLVYVTKSCLSKLGGIRLQTKANMYRDLSLDLSSTLLHWFSWLIGQNSQPIELGNNYLCGTYTPSQAWISDNTPHWRYTIKKQ